MKPTKTKKNGKTKAIGKTAAPKKKEKAVPVKAVKGSGSGVGADKKRSDDKTITAARKKTAGGLRLSKTQKAGERPRTDVVSKAAGGRRKTSVRRISPREKTEDIPQKEKKPKTRSGATATEKLKNVTAAAPRPWIRNAGITGDLSFKRRRVKIRGRGDSAASKARKTPGHALPQGTGGRINRLRRQHAGKSGRTGRTAAIGEIVPPALPEEYGENEFFLIPVEPRVVYASWEILKDSLPRRKGRLAVRFFEVMETEGSSYDKAFLDIAISAGVGDAFFHVGIQGREIVAEIGHLGADGYFSPLLRSRKVLIPSSLESEEFDIFRKSPHADSCGSRPPER